MLVDTLLQAAAEPTGARQDTLFEFGRADLSPALLAEAHTDALAVFEEVGQGAP